VVLSGCQLKSAYLKPPLEEEGEVFLYVQPFPAEARPLRFHIGEVAALREDGAAFPLSLAVSEFTISSMSRQRLVASGVLPAGSYTGLLFRATKAFLKGEEGETALSVPEERVLEGFPFAVRKAKSSVIGGMFRPADAVQGKSGFSPAFSLFRPEQPMTALLGYVANYGSNNITVFNKKSGQVSGVIATGMGPRGIALHRGLQRAYVALAGDDAVDVIDIVTGDSIQKINLNAGDRPQEPALTPDGRLLLTANKGSDTVSIIDAVSLIELERISVGNGPNSVLIEATGRRAYVFNTLSDRISVIDLSGRKVSATIATDSGPLRGQMNSRGDRLYVIHSLSSNLTVIDPVTLSVLQRISVGREMSSLKFDTRTNRIILGKRFDPLISVYEPGLAMPIDTILTRGGVSFISIDNDENNLYLLIPGKRILASINLVSGATVSELDVGEGAYWVTMTGER